MRIYVQRTREILYGRVYVYGSVCDLHSQEYRATLFCGLCETPLPTALRDRMSDCSKVPLTGAMRHTRGWQHCALAAWRGCGSRGPENHERPEHEQAKQLVCKQVRLGHPLGGLRVVSRRHHQWQASSAPSPISLLEQPRLEDTTSGADAAGDGLPARFDGGLAPMVD